MYNQRKTSRSFGSFKSRGPYKQFVAPYNIPKKHSQTDLIEKLFSLVADMDIDKIVKYLSEHNISYNATNSDNENVLHIILKNSNKDISEKQKFDLVGYFLKWGASPSQANKNNVTPLHLAAKHQLLSIVKLLVKNGADARMTDNSGMNPLHYMILSELQQCKKPEIVGDIVPKTEAIKKHKNTLKKLTLILTEILTTNLFTMQFNHIKNSFESFETMYSEKFMEYNKNITDALQKITEIKTTDIPEGLTYQEKQLAIKENQINKKKCT